MEDFTLPPMATPEETHSATLPLMSYRPEGDRQPRLDPAGTSAVPPVLQRAASYFLP